jgi:Tol biopolymer transport system component
MANNLVPGDTNNSGDVFVHDLATGELLRASVDFAGGNPNEWVGDPRLSADGRRVAFESRATDLVPGDTNGMLDVFVRDLELGLTLRASVADDGAQATLDCHFDSISGDGTRVAFTSKDGALVPGDSGMYFDVFVRDLAQGWTRRVSVASDGSEASRGSFGGVLSADGSRVVFLSRANNLDPADTNSFDDAYLHDLETGRTLLVSQAWDGAVGNGVVSQAVLSGDGTKVAFTSRSDNLLPGDTNGWDDVFLRDLVTGALELISSPVGGGPADFGSNGPSLSHDGRFVLFQSPAKNLVPDDVPGMAELYLRDRLANTLEIVNLTSLGELQTQASYFGVISADGRAVAFHSLDEDLVPFDLNSDYDVFVRERWGAVPTVVGYCAPSATSVPGCEVLLEGHGPPSLAAASGFELDSGPVPGGTLGILNFGARGPAATPLGTLGGLDCIALFHAKLPAVGAGGTPGVCDGGVLHTLADLAAAHPTVVLPGATLHAQLWLRDTGNPDGFALSSGVWFQILP